MQQSNDSPFMSVRSRAKSSIRQKAIRSPNSSTEPLRVNSSASKNSHFPSRGRETTIWLAQRRRVRGDALCTLRTAVGEHLVVELYLHWLKQNPSCIVEEELGSRVLRQSMG